jgi:hypothetical protein
MQSARTGFNLADTLSKTNLVRLSLMALLFTIVDTIQSFYAQKVLNVFTEFNFLPSLFYDRGPLGFALYAPIEFSAILATLLMLWIWASYVLWFHSNVVSKVKVLAR